MVTVVFFVCFCQKKFLFCLTFFSFLLGLPAKTAKTSLFARFWSCRVGVQDGAGGGDGGSKERTYPSGYNVVPTSIPPFFFHFTRQKILIFFLSPQQMTVETDAMYSSDSDFISDDGGDAPLIVSSKGQTSVSQIKVWKLKVKGLKGVVKRLSRF